MPAANLQQQRKSNGGGGWGGVVVWYGGGGVAVGQYCSIRIATMVFRFVVVVPVIIGVG